MIDVQVKGGTLEQAEIDAYIVRGRELYPNRILSGIDIDVDGEYVGLTYHFAQVPFERIRRITGYLVGTVDRFNDAKKAELKDRLKHSI
ncbi:MAG: hypothetical protein GXX99_02470 [Clostridiales bacterium]|nr:hypothetical protein [Clostridiales bacterium]